MSSSAEPSLTPSTIRNVAVVGHRGCGKTSLVEAMLFRSGAIDRLGTVVQGTTVCDADDDERRRQMTISSALCHLRWDGVTVNLIDTPGEPSFHAETLGALSAADTALMVVGAVDGVQVFTERLWQRAVELGLPRAVAVSMLDRARADMDDVMASLHALDQRVVALQVPIGSEHSLRGVVDLIDMTATTYGADGEPTTGPVPDDVAVAAEAARDVLVETVASTDDALIEEYLSGEELTRDELIGALRVAVAHGDLVPVVCVSGAPVPMGVERLLDTVVQVLPSPVDGPVRDAVTVDSGETLHMLPEADGPAVALCIKTLADPFSGRVNVMRVLAGTLVGDSQVVCARTGARERVGRLFRLQGKEHVPCSALGPGDLGAVAKLKGVATGDALCGDEPLVAFPPVPLPQPSMSFRVNAHDRGDDDKVVTLLRRMAEEDPSLDVHQDAETGDLIMGGMSELHVEVVAERIAERFGVQVDLAPPHVPYRETITGTARAEGKHKKQSGGRGQYADCWVRVEPLERGAGMEFVDKVVGGAIPRQFIGAVEAGVRAALRRGGVAGYPVVDLRVTLDDGKHHAVDSSEMAFSIAGGMAVKEAIAHARPVLLEPVMHVEITVAPDQVGDIMGDLSARRGQPLGIEMRGDREVISAEVPMVEMLAYGADLRQITAGRGDYAMRLDHYAPAPGGVAQRAAADAMPA